MKWETISKILNIHEIDPELTNMEINHLIETCEELEEQIIYENDDEYYEDALEYWEHLHDYDY